MADISTIDEKKWREAKRRAAVLKPLMVNGILSSASAKIAATELGLSVRHVYSLAKKLNSDGSVLSDIVAHQSDGGKGKSRLSKEQERIIRMVIKQMLPDKRKFSTAAIIREIGILCRRAGEEIPSDATVRRRITEALASWHQKRNGTQDQSNLLVGETPEAAFPLAFVQMDHTLADIILVDPVERLPIGRPWLTLAIDVFSRCIAGFHIDLEPPSATSVGLCLTHIAADKTAWLKQRDIHEEWRICGKPLEIGVDNAKEFKSRAFRRGCAQHGITIRYRPPGQPHYGGIIERVIGTFMKNIHETPGTTLSNPAERGEYPSEKMACMTFEEFERYLAIAITQYYHLRLHHGIRDVPATRIKWSPEGLSSTTIQNLHAYLVDFLPLCKRMLRREGFVLNHISYYSPAFQNWLREGRAGEYFVIRRDPRDLSRIYVEIPQGGGYIEATYRNISHPVITLFEHRAALKRLRARIKEEIDENKLFHAIEDMRRIEAGCKIATLKKRREVQRKNRAMHAQSYRNKDRKCHAGCFGLRTRVNKRAVSLRSASAIGESRSDPHL
jgi:putative transposase